MPIINRGIVSCDSSIKPVQAKEMPIAKASMLVAMAKSNCVRNLLGLIFFISKALPDHLTTNES